MAPDTGQLTSPTNDNEITNFHHPFTPYDVQLQFMRAVYDVLQRGEGQVGILESPTGTVCGIQFAY